MLTAHIKISMVVQKNITGPFLDKKGVYLRKGGGTVLDSGNNRWVGPGVYKNGSMYYLIRHAI
ncbi:hypothetical protein [Cellulosilyticum ruminicola]|uniref:hypothetical protein n=1 Tax=Cellulosilyticum ruminicola TaxID=425254 RepID=UPI0009F8170A|nr:hypothetical protein [Cellulosilyticum ruminicola]